MRVLLKFLVVPVLLVEALVLLGSGVTGVLRSKRRRTASFPHHPPQSTVIGADAVTVYNYGDDLYDEMLSEIRGAQRRIYFETFIWKDDAVGQAFKDALVAAGRRGVDVFVMYDGFGNLVVPRKFKTFPDCIETIEYPAYAPGWKVYDPRRYGRDHHKILCVDDRVGFLGGYNIGSLYAKHWRDMHVRIEGPSSWHLRQAFELSWNRSRTSDQPSLDQPGSPTWESRIRVHRNAPREREFPIRDMYLQAINRATSHIRLSHAYFVPDRAIFSALLRAVDRGVDVRLLVPQKSNHPVMDWLSQRYFDDLLDAGGRVFLFQDAMIHTKSATIDGHWATIGTANIDRMSLAGNYEVNAEFFDPVVARHLEDAFRTDCTQATEPTLEQWRRRSPARKLLAASVAPLRPLL